ncbi:MAG TPA: type II toxin-antitoxin system VapC family toxin [Verrucomicrobiales bacterium]|nr:type II toxin-antitoxin system VapC family toxin [Verrucomicrobiales bacterium]
MGLILDSSFVIAAEREARRGVAGPADTFLARRASEVFFITFTVTGELACGKSASDRSAWESLCRPYPVLPWTMEIARIYGEIYRALAATGNLIGSNDLWIAATGLVHQLGVVTNNVDEFRRVPGLVVETF